MYLLRLDDASDHMNIENWKRMEALLDKYEIKPIYGIIPDNKDPDLLKYNKVDDFWDLMLKWQDKGWIPAMHGYSHVFETEEGGINPVNRKSEFAGVSFEIQCEKIKNGNKILLEHGLNPDIFFAPAHTFDLNTLRALEKMSEIRIISDTIANDVYFRNGFHFIPQQSGQVRTLPFKLVTFCYHPNEMLSKDFDRLELFLNNNRNSFGVFSRTLMNGRRRNVKDKCLEKLYFFKRVIFKQ